MGLFKKLLSKRVPLEQQLSVLKSLELVLNPAVTVEDLCAFQELRSLESSPYQGLVEVMGIDLEREPYLPMCDRLWMCDYERVEDHGAYREVVERLEVMTASRLKLRNISDFVDVEEGYAWVEFDYQGERVHWDFVVDDDWLDPAVLVSYDRLLKNASSPLRIYSNHTDYGQSALLAAFTPEAKRRFDKLTKISLRLIEDQA